MADFDAKIEMFSAFYINTEKAITVAPTTTQLKMQQIKAELRVFRKGLQDAPFILGRDKTISPQLYSDILKASVQNLSATRKSMNPKACD